MRCKYDKEINCDMKDNIGYCACGLCELSKGKEPINPRCQFTGEVCRIKEQMGEVVCKTCKYNIKKTEVVQSVVKDSKVDNSIVELKEFYNFDNEPIVRAQKHKECLQLLTTENTFESSKLVDHKNRDVHIKNKAVQKESLFDRIKKFFGR